VILRQDSAEQLVMLLIKRNSRDDDPWSGQMAFPGGRSKKDDASLLATAKRESNEETGIQLDQSELIGELDEVVSGRFVVRVSPYVFFSEKFLDVTIDRSEVSEYFWIPLNYFRNKNNISSFTFERAGEKLELPCYRYQGDQIIWGMTLRIIEDFISKTQKLNSA
jgi:8-oxo-dGTP pyrophosphatase MutT (NUDIX family)